MTAAYRLKGLGWLGGCSIVLLGFYLVSVQVAAERKKLYAIEAKIMSAQRDIRALETEFDVRANLVQLERWNGDTLALVAPSAGQFVRDEGALSAIRFDGGPGGGTVQTAAYVVPAVTEATATPAVDPAPVPVAEPVVAPVRVAAKSDVKAPAPQPAPRPAPRMVQTAAVKATPATKKAQAVAMLDRTLLSDTTLGDLMSGARAERGRLR